MLLHYYMRWLFLACLLACGNNNDYQPPDRSKEFQPTQFEGCLLIYKYSMECMDIWHFDCDGKDVWNADWTNVDTSYCQQYRQSLEDAGYIE